MNNMKKKIFALLALAMTTMTASAIPGYNLTVGTNDHGTITFKVGSNENATYALEGDEVTVVVKADKAYMIKSDGVTARAYTSFGGAQAPRRNAPGSIEMLDWLTVTKSAEVDTVFTFTMPAYSVQVNAAYDHRALTNDMIHAIADQTWTGSAVTPTLVVTDRDYTLTEGTDYTVSYSGNTDMGVNTATATITAKTDIDDHYIGTASASFSIRKTIAGLTAYAVSSEENPIIYTGDPQTPEVVVRDARVTLVKDVDYTVSYQNNVNAGQAQFTVTGLGKYQGELVANFLINTRDLSSEMIAPVTGITYTGSAQYPALVITYNGKTLVEGLDDGSNQTTCDYYTTYENNTETGEARVKIEGVNNFSGTFYYTFNIDAKPLTEDMIDAIADLTYTGNALEPAPVVTYNGMTLNAGTDYTVSYENNTDAGTATLTISATAQNNNYTGSAQKTFNILKADVNVTAAPTVKTGLVYTAEAQPLVNAGTVEGGEMQYSLDGVEYASTVSTGTDAGTYTVYYKTVGDQNHNDVAPQTLTVSIAKAVLTTMTLAENTFTYNKEEQTAQVSTVSAGTISVGAEDYDVTGNQQTNVGQYTATVTAKATSTNFTGSVTAQYSIVPADAQIFTMTLDPESFVYNGLAQQPTVTVQDGSAILTEGTDYDLAFENNVNAGTAKVTATGKGNYVNTQEATFTIQKANAQLGTAPAALTLTYNYGAQQLVSAGAITAVGTTDESKLQYSIDGVNFSDDIPTATDAGQYTVSYYVQGDANHNDTEVLTVSCAIQKAQGTMAFTETGYDLTYGDVPFTNAVTQYGDNDIRFVSSDPRVAEVQYYTGEVTIKGVGQCTITAMMQEHSNFKKQAANITYTVSIAAREITEDNVTVGEQGENGVPEITVSVEAPVGTLTPVEGTDYQLDYYDLERNAVSVEQMAVTPGEYVAVLTFYGNYAGYVEKTITVNNITTGISAMPDAQSIKQGDAYDLQGRRAAQPTKGLYIVNGKKMVVR